MVVCSSYRLPFASAWAGFFPCCLHTAAYTTTAPGWLPAVPGAWRVEVYAIIGEFELPTQTKDNAIDARHFVEFLCVSCGQALEVIQARKQVKLIRRSTRSES